MNGYQPKQEKRSCKLCYSSNCVINQPRNLDGTRGNYQPIPPTTGSNIQNPAPSSGGMNCNTAHSIIEDFQRIYTQYRWLVPKTVIESNGVAILALEKQIPQKPKMVGDDYASSFCCPSCNQPITNVWNNAEYKPNYCHYCGQRLDWSK